MRAIYLIIVAYLLLASCYAYATPPFESPDELYHAGFMDYVASTGWIPQQVVGVETRFEQEGSQPPLYYLITGMLVAGIDRSDFDRVTQINPHAIIGDPSAEGNKNMVLHDDPYPPRLSGTTLALFMGRVFSILCGTVTVLAVYQCGRVLAPDRPSVALLAAGLTAHAQRWAAQDELRDEVEDLGRPTVELPLLTGPMDVGSLFELAGRLEDHLRSEVAA